MSPLVQCGKPAQYMIDGVWAGILFPAYFFSIFLVTFFLIMGLIVFPLASLCSQIVVVFLALKRYRILPLEMKVLALYFAFVLYLAIMQGILGLNGIRNIWTSELSLPVEFALLLLVFYWYFGKQELVRKVLLLGIVIFVLSWVGSTIWFGNMDVLYPYHKTGAAALIVLASCYALVRVAVTSEGSVRGHPMFWVASGNIIFFAGTIVFYSLSGAIFESSLTTMRVAWAIHAVVIVIANVVYIRGVLCFRLS